ncbi:hypothetical protein L9F63_014938 [Diploptera punctata]|uniref:C2H2-type domain-containing protein n=1 Tax=Diploptera punctata TaxID=6984 RepID=A0AAD8A720_DIPPU|nr:hypothetical protein L9F63_014938 [Diploptera punctata]
MVLHLYAPTGNLEMLWTSLTSSSQSQFSVQEWNSPTSENSDIVLIHPCPHCTKRYKFRTSLYRHLKFECGKEPTFRCPHCAYMTKQKAPMQRHIRNTHGIPC